MSGNKIYNTEIDSYEALICARCDEALLISPVNLSYLGHGFPVELPCCPKCGMIFIPEELAVGKILHVEKSLEDK